MNRTIALVTLAFVTLNYARTDEPKLGPARTAAEHAKWTVDDVVLSELASGFAIAPDCKHVVWVKSVQDKDKGSRVGNLVRSSLGAKEEIELTRGPESCVAPKWSPDGKKIAFLSARAKPKAGGDEDDDKNRAGDKSSVGKPQIWLINAFGGEAWPLTEGSRGVLSHDWADSDTVIYTAQEDPSLHEKDLKEEKKDSAIVVEDEKNEPPVRLFKVTVKDKKVTRLTTNTDRIQAFTLSPDGRRAVTVHDRSLSFTFDHKVRPGVYLQDLENGERKQVFADRKFNIGKVQWTRDGKGFYAASDYTSHPQFLNATITHLYHYDLESARPTMVDLDWDKGLSGSVFECTKDGFIALLADGARNKAARYRRDGAAWKRDWLEGDHAKQLFDLRLGNDGSTLLYNHSTASTPVQWYRAGLEKSGVKAPQQLTELNEHLKKKTLAKTELIRWNGALNEEVEGLLYYPHDYQAGKKYPLVLMIHGGPASLDHDAWEERWAYAPNLMCQRGAFVLKPNYHGSTNYGLKFVESIADGKYYEYPIIDIENGVDHLIAKGLVDPANLGTLGWSNGAILTTALIVHNQRYKAACAGAGGAEWVGDWGACEFGMSFSNYYFGKSPIEDPQLYIKMAPLYQFGKVKTPTLLIHGTEDRQVPTHDGWAQFRALQQYGKAEVRFVLMPGEKHGLIKLANQRRKLEEELAWFDRHLFGTAKDDRVVFKADSPLARALKLHSASRAAGRYGVLYKDILIPETVLHEGLDIGRFEITCGQFAQFNPKHTVAPGRENYPANRITFEQAQAYCAWLSKATGETYRLPNEDDADTLYRKSDAKENTLDFWAGGAVNPEDAPVLREKIKDLGSATLLREVGTFQGAGKDDMAYDLGGNVAEWVVSNDGKGKVMGGSADQPADAKQAKRSPAQEFIGFRVVKGQPTSKEVIFQEGAKLKVEVEGGAGGEGPAWHPKLGLLTSGDGHIFRLSREGKSAIHRKDTGTNGLLFDAKGRLLACEPVARRVTRTEFDGAITVLTERYQGKRYNQPNDITVDGKGRIYFSDPQYGERKGMEILDDDGKTIEGVYRIDTDKKVTRIIGRELERPNGILVSADDRFLFIADNNNNTKDGARKLLRFDLKKDGSVDFTSRKLLFDWQAGRGPDGIKQDVKGRLFVAAGLTKPNPPFEPAADKKGGIYVFEPDGKLLTFLPVPRDEVTNCAFGGDDLRTLYITAGGTIYSVRTVTPGRIVWPK